MAIITTFDYRGPMGTIHILFSTCSVIYTYICKYIAYYSALSSSTNATDKTLLFEIVFVIVWIGAAIISLNGSLLGGKM